MGGAAHLEYGQAHPFHILPPSPWPYLTGLNVLHVSRLMDAYSWGAGTCKLGGKRGNMVE